MALVFRPDKKSIEKTLAALKSYGNLVAPDARFNYDAKDGLRKEVCFRDEDFLSLLSSIDDEYVVDSILEMLKGKALVPPDAFYSKDAFDKLVALTKEKWYYPWTSFTKAMRRLFYMLASIKQPRIVVGMGIFYGYTLAWSAGPSCGKDKLYNAERVYGVDINTEAIEGARKNFAILEGSDHVELIAEDGRLVAQRLEGPVVFLHLDADGEKIGKKLYLELLKILYPKLAKGAWVLAHDVTDPGFQKQGVFTEYLNYVRDPKYFSESILFDIDQCGLELSIK
ncbi:class I SAM-dependent methyltransferase [candidate division WOR-3 bacterium]|nr:class I SAM-dependent methyltransferase [candidate division WOR-3 bacterium]